MAYLRETQKTSLGHITRLIPYRRADTLALDEMTRRSLELVRTLREGKREGSLLSGDRLHGDADGRPAAVRMADVAADVDRADRRTARRRRGAVQPVGPARRLRSLLGQAYDLERLAARVGTGRATPRDLVALARTLGHPAQAQGPAHRAGLETAQPARSGASSSAPRSAPRSRRPWCDDPPLAVKEGGLIRDGYHAELDELRDDRQGRQVVDRQVSGRADPPHRASPASRSASTRSSATTSRSPTPRRRPAARDPGRLHPQADGQERRAVHHARAEGVRGKGPPCRGPRLRAGIRAVHDPARPGRGRGPAADPGRRGAGAARRAGVRWPSWPRGTATAGPRSSPSRSSKSRPAGIPCSTRSCRPATSSPTTSSWAPTTGSILLDHRPEHGRQEHLHPPGRPDRDPGAHRAASSRPGARGSASSTASSPASARPTS